MKRMGEAGENSPSLGKKKKKKKWIHTRHKVIWIMAKPIVFLLARVRYGFHYQKVSRKEYRQSLVLSNHQCTYDQFFLFLSFPKPVYFIASEAIFSKSIFGRFMCWVAAPIPIKKSTSDVRTVSNILQVVKEGGSIAIFPEGNRSYAGPPVYIKKTVANLAKKLKIRLVLYNIRGAYGVDPRWSDRIRKGRCSGEIARILEPEELKEMSVDEIYEVIVSTLGLDDHDYPQKLKAGHLAEHLERVIYVCPKCGLSTFSGKKDLISCNGCGLTAEYQPDLSFRGIDGEFPYKNEAEWYAAQEDAVRSLDRNAYLEKVAYEDEISLYRVIPYQKAVCMSGHVKLSLYSDRLELCAVDGNVPKCIPYEEVESMTVQNANILLVFMKNSDMYRIIGNDVSYNAVKYVNFFAHYQGKGMYELTGLDCYEGEKDTEFLGL